MTTNTLVTRDRVFRAAEELVVKNERPTQNNIRKVLGGGSFGPIGDFLNEWKSQKKIEHEISEVKIPESFNERIEQLAKVLWKASVNEAERKLTIEREEINESNRKAHIAVSDANEAVIQLEQEADVNKIEISIKNNLITDLEKTVSIKNSEARQLELKIAAKEKVEVENKQLSDELNSIKPENKNNLVELHSVKEKLIKLEYELNNTKNHLSTTQKSYSDSKIHLNNKDTEIKKIKENNKKLDSEKNNLDLQIHKHQASLDTAVNSLNEAKHELKELRKALNDKNVENGVLLGKLESTLKKQKINHTIKGNQS